MHESIVSSGSTSMNEHNRARFILMDADEKSVSSIGKATGAKMTKITTS